jgi:hypothetical protein
MNFPTELLHQLDILFKLFLFINVGIFEHLDKDVNVSLNRCSNNGTLTKIGGEKSAVHLFRFECVFLRLCL